MTTLMHYGQTYDVTTARRMLDTNISHKHRKFA